MTSPISIFLKALRLRTGLTQLEQAQLMGYEQAYVSAIESGIKSPGDAFLTKVVGILKINEHDQMTMALAMKQSKRRFTLSSDSSTEIYLLVNALWDKIDLLYPAQIQAISELLKLDEQMAERPRYQPTRIRKNRKSKEVAM